MVLVPLSFWVPLTGVVIVLSIVLAGGVAGYLQGNEPREGAIVGAFAGIVMVSPIVLLLLFGAVGNSGGDGAMLLFMGFPFVLGCVIFTMFGGALGGFISGRDPHVGDDGQNDDHEFVSRGQIDAREQEPASPQRDRLR